MTVPRAKTNAERVPKQQKGCEGPQRGGRKLKWRETFLVGNFCPFFYAGVDCGLYP